MTTLTPDEIIATPSMEAVLQLSTFTGWHPQQTPSRVVVFDDPEFRVERGIPAGSPAAAGYAQFYGQVNDSTLFIGYDDPENWDTKAEFRYMPGDYSPLGWEKFTPVLYTASATLGEQEPAPLATVTRTWSKLRDLETWQTAKANETWNSLIEYVLETESPSWLPYGALEPELAAGYVYWRSNEYVPNDAVMIYRQAGLSMVWAPTRTPNQVTVVMVIVPGFMGGSSYTLMQASPSIKAVLNSDSTVSLTIPGNNRKSVLLAGRTRPNEPVVVGLSVSLDGSNRVSLLAVDSNIRLISGVSSTPLTFGSLTWIINPDGLATMEILEMDVYSSVLSESAMMQVASIFDRIYGVTAL